MRAATLRLLVYLWVLRPAFAAADFDGFGPIPARNFQPIQMIFLNLPVERARVLGPGAVALRIESAEINEIATDNPPVDARLKFESNRTLIGGSFGVLPGLEVGLDLPFISRFGGFLDPPIDSIEDFFGTSNYERKIFPNNSFAGFYVRRDNIDLFRGPRETLELGDLWVSAKYAAWQRENWPTLALRAAVKAPTGNAHAVNGSGKPDIGVGLAADYQPFSRILLYGNLNLIYPFGPITPARLTLNPIFTQAVAAEGYVGGGVSLVLQQDFYTSPMHGTGSNLLDGNVNELAAGINWTWRSLLVQLAGIDNISRVISSADFSLLLRLTWQTGGGTEPS